MKDRISLHPGRVRLVPVAGQEHTYDLVRADEPTQEGTVLNKETLLKDATAAALGLTADAFPDDALNKVKGLIDKAQAAANAAQSRADNTFTKPQTLTDAVCELLNIPKTSVPNDAFAKLAMGGSNKYVFDITLKTNDGVPLPNVTISGVKTLSGGEVVTNNAGFARGVADSASPTVSVPPWPDMTGTTKKITSAGVITAVEFIVTKKAAQETAYYASASGIQFSSLVRHLDFCCLGGGGGGYDADNGGGGGGGSTTNLLNYTYTGAILNLYVGAGGAAGNSGGASSVTLSSGTQIAIGYGGNAGGPNRGGESTNGGGGGFKSAGGSASVRKFNDASQGYAGGGGGGGGVPSPRDNVTPYSGGAPYGGRGAYYDYNAVAGGRGGGGGGGCNYYDDHFGSAAAGGAGAIFVRWRYV